MVGVHLPPLRKRRGDTPLLANAFLEHCGRDSGGHLASSLREAMDALMRHSYPGNVWELQNLVERAVVMARDASITTRDLPSELLRPEAPAPGGDAHPDRAEPALQA